MADYQFDVFVSYERDGLTTGWIMEHFLPLFRTWVRYGIRELCNRPAQPIFFDKSQVDPSFPSDLKLEVAGIDPGDVWEDALKEALRVSRCMVGIWNPTYFDSRWCNVEWETFDRRATKTGCRLIVAGNFHDGNSFPPRAAAIERIDLRPFTLFGPALINSKRYGDFQDTMKLLARQVALSVRDAPPFEDWALADDISAPPSRPPITMPRFANGG